MFLLGCPLQKDFQLFYLELCSEKTFHILICNEAVSLLVGADWSSGSSHEVCFGGVGEYELCTFDGQDELSRNMVSSKDTLGDNIDNVLRILGIR